MFLSLGCCLLGLEHQDKYFSVLYIGANLKKKEVKFSTEQIFICIPAFARGSRRIDRLTGGWGKLPTWLWISQITLWDGVSLSMLWWVIDKMVWAFWLCSIEIDYGGLIRDVELMSVLCGGNVSLGLWCVGIGCDMVANAEWLRSSKFSRRWSKGSEERTRRFRTDQPRS